MAVPETLPAPGWFDDPAGSSMLRWWAGDRWSDEFRDTPRRALRAASRDVEHEGAVQAGALRARALVDEPVVASTYIPMADYQARPAIREYARAVGSPQTTAIWMLALYPVIALALQLIVVLNPNRPDIQILVGIVQVGAIFGLAVWDSITLRDRNIDGPSLWWLLLAYPLSYLVARWITLSSRGLAGAGPPLVFIASAVAAVFFLTSPGMIF